MNLCVIYTCIIIIVKFVQFGDKYPYQPSGGDDGDDSDEDDIYDVIVMELEDLIEGDETPGDTVVSDNIIEHGLGSITGQGYIQPGECFNIQPEQHTQYCPSYKQYQLKVLGIMNQ